MKINKFFAVVMIALWGSLVVLNLIAPKKDFSELENRALQPWPSWDTGEFIEGKLMLDVEQYLNDRVIWRDKWVEMKCYAELALGKRENGGVYIAKDRLLENISTPDAEKVEGNIAGVNALSKVYSGNIYLMIVPSAMSVQEKYLPTFATSWDQKLFMKSIYEKLDDKVTPVNVYDTLSEHSDEYIFYRTDHHWTAKGAYYSYLEFAKAAGLKARESSEFKITKLSDDFNGTLFSKSGFRGIEDDTIEKYEIGKVKLYEKNLKYAGGKAFTNENYDTIYFDEQLQVKDKYAYFLKENVPFSRITTESESGKKLLIFKDSYAMSFVTMLLEDYTEIMLVDMRYDTPSFTKIVDFNEYDDVLFLYSTDLFANQNATNKLVTISDILQND